MDRVYCGLRRRVSHAPLLRGRRHGLDGKRVELTPAVARASHHEHRGLVEHAVQGAQERVVALEELVPVAGDGVVGENHGV